MSEAVRDAVREAVLREVREAARGAVMVRLGWTKTTSEPQI